MPLCTLSGGPADGRQVEADGPVIKVPAPPDKFNPRLRVDIYEARPDLGRTIYAYVGSQGIAVNTASFDQVIKGRKFISAGGEVMMSDGTDTMSIAKCERSFYADMIAHAMNIVAQLETAYSLQNLTDDDRNLRGLSLEDLNDEIAVSLGLFLLKSGAIKMSDRSLPGGLMERVGSVRVVKPEPKR